MVGGGAVPRATAITLKPRQCVAPSGVVVGHGRACLVVPDATAQARGVVGTFRKEPVVFSVLPVPSGWHNLVPRDGPKTKGTLRQKEESVRRSVHQKKCPHRRSVHKGLSNIKTKKSKSSHVSCQNICTVNLTCGHSLQTQSVGTKEVVLRYTLNPAHALPPVDNQGVEIADHVPE